MADYFPMVGFRNNPIFILGYGGFSPVAMTRPCPAQWEEDPRLPLSTYGDPEPPTYSSYFSGNSGYERIDICQPSIEGNYHMGELYIRRFIHAINPDPSGGNLNLSLSYDYGSDGGYNFGATIILREPNTGHTQNSVLAASSPTVSIPVFYYRLQLEYYMYYQGYNDSTSNVWLRLDFNLT